MDISKTPGPATRMQRLRRTPAMRALMQETVLHISDLVLPVFVAENTTRRDPIPALPGIFRETENTLPAALKAAEDLGIKAVALFGVSDNKDETGSDSFRSGGLIDRMIRIAKESCPDLLVISDACFCGYTTHGHCGCLDTQGRIDNDRTLENLALQSITAASAGADIIAPSGMMDGMVAKIRNALDSHGHHNTAILSYAVKYASCFYGPFRDASGCALGAHANAPRDRKTYQMNPANLNESLREAALDIAEGADMLMVKPGLPYLDVMRALKDRFDMPLFAYHVSGEYAMLRAASEKGWLDYDEALLESLLSFKRAGCTGILTYGALDAAKLLRDL